ncbi:MAG TPA: hypothetical protein VKZ85_03320 [Woeseiaceae bacterium]|nr:hypothetical protein [Woeseiaceae bacterium]
MAAICRGGEAYRQKLMKMGMKNPPPVKVACEFHEKDVLRGPRKK